MLGFASYSDGENWWEKALDFVFWDPGLLVRVKLNRLKNRAHLACPEFSLLADLCMTDFYGQSTQ